VARWERSRGSWVQKGLGTKGTKGCIGTKGTIEYGQNVGPTGVLLDGRPAPNEDIDVNPFHTMLREFHTAIVQRREPETSALRCRVVVEMIEAILKSCRTHEVVPITGKGAIEY
jgi:predicted dehydrogenase